MSSNKKTLVFQGGLGNQLFQFAYLHNIFAATGKPVDVYFPKPKDGAREFKMQKILESCTHTNQIKLKRTRKIDLRFTIEDFLRFRFSDKRWVSQIGKISREENSYLFEKIDSRCEYFSGYFQNWQYVKSQIDCISAELAAHLKTVRSKILLNLQGVEYGVLHFRRGDLLNYQDSMGILTTEYFENALRIAGSITASDSFKTIVISDDKEIAVRNFLDLGVPIYGPDDLSEWESLALMADAKFVITSNSTFSWWGGLLASRRGGVAIIPDPWFLNWDPMPSQAFQYPGFKIVPSIFLSTK